MHVNSVIFTDFGNPDSFAFSPIRPSKEIRVFA